MTSPYLNRPHLSLAVALPRRLEQIEANDGSAAPAKKRRLRRLASMARRIVGSDRGVLLTLMWQ
jgi:hypothetical protein